MDLTSVSVSGLVLAGTVIQAVTTFMSSLETEEDLVDHWLTEDELVREVPWWKWAARRRARRAVRHLVNRHDERELWLRLQRLRWSLRSWELLMIAAFVTFVDAVWP